MTDPLIPETMDCRKAFVRRAVVTGQVPVERLMRFGAMLVDTAGNIDADLRFVIDEANRKVIMGTVSASVNVRCQRCLETLAVEISEELQLAVVESEGLAERLPAELDAWITDDPLLHLHDIVEEQLILGMPIVTRHAVGECEPAVSGESGPGDKAGVAVEPRKDNPFAALEVLKTRGHGSSGSKTEH
jgi:uncharacterized protein